jgi:hypothetical protein
LHLLTLWCDSSIARLWKYAKKQASHGACFLLKGAIRLGKGWFLPGAAPPRRPECAAARIFLPIFWRCALAGGTLPQGLAEALQTYAACLGLDAMPGDAMR